jgi:thiol:disulfide interchange protein DsbG
MSKKINAPKFRKSLFKSPLGIAILAVALGAVLAGFFLATPTSSLNAPDAPSSSNAPEATGANLARIAVEAKGFSVGPQLRAHTTYVFFDTQCIYCGALWTAMKPLESQTRAVWIPVGVLNRASVNQGALILGATDPVARMNEHEELLTAKKGGISAMGSASNEMARIIEVNTKLMKEMGGTSVPYVVSRHALTGELVTNAGAAPTAFMATKLGLRMPRAE